jgi:hypothetical protein
MIAVQFKQQRLGPGRHWSQGSWLSSPLDVLIRRHLVYPRVGIVIRIEVWRKSRTRRKSSRTARGDDRRPHTGSTCEVHSRSTSLSRRDMSLSLRGRCKYRRCEYRKIQHEQAVFHALIRSTAAFRSKLRIVSGGPGVKFWFVSDPSDEFHAASLTSLSRNSTKNVAANALGSDCNLYSSGSCRVLSVELVYQAMAN